MFFKKKFKKINQRLHNLEEENKQIKRICKYAREGKITFHSDGEMMMNSMGCLYPTPRYFSYVYKDGNEYKFYDVYFNHPAFFAGGDRNIYAQDGNITYKLNLDTCEVKNV